VSPVRHFPSPRPLTVTNPGERPPGEWRFSSHLALVLGGGGARGAYQVGVLAGLAERLPGLAFPILAGTSVGAINTTYLAAHPGALPDAVAGLRGEWSRLTSDAVYQVHAGRLTRALLRWAWRAVTGRPGHGASALHELADTQPLREFLTSCLDPNGISANIDAGRLRCVGVGATSYTSGRSVTFVQGTADTPVWQRAQRVSVRTRLTVEHVMASAALPIVFPAIRIGDEFFGDGSVRQMAPLSPAIHLGAHAVIAIGLNTPNMAPRATTPLGAYPSTAEAIGLLFRAVFLDALDGDAEELERVNRMLALFPAGVPTPQDLRPVELLLLRPTRDLGGLITSSRSALLPLPVRRLLRVIGGQRAESSEFLGFLLFHPEHTSRLVELGYEDVGAHWPAIERFFIALERKPTEA